VIEAAAAQLHGKRIHVRRMLTQGRFESCTALSKRDQIPNTARVWPGLLDDGQYSGPLLARMWRNRHRRAGSRRDCLEYQQEWIDARYTLADTNNNAVMVRRAHRPGGSQPKLPPLPDVVDADEPDVFRSTTSLRSGIAPAYRCFSSRCFDTEPGHPWL